MIMRYAHKGTARAHSARKEIAHKTMHARIWWPMIFRDTKDYYNTCDACQRVGKPSRRYEMPLNL